MNKKENYGILTDMSKSLNELLGDYSGITVSRRTTIGFKRSFNINDLSNDEAEHIVHGAMIWTGFMLNSKNKNTNIFGILLLLALVVFYQSGK
jgi:hypothetical protein